ncbi:hypothetical protein D3C75_870700 [compost metagenome]
MKFGAPSTNSGSSGCSGMNTKSVLLLVTRSRPWSKNWPKKVIQALKPAVKPTSGDTLGMKNTSVSSAVPNTPSMPGLITGAAPPLASTAAGLFAVWSTIRLLMVRGCESVTVPVPA